MNAANSSDYIYCINVVSFTFNPIYPQVDSNWSSGNYEEAQRNANIAKVLNIVGFVVGILAWIVSAVIVVVYVVLFAAAAAAANTTVRTSTTRFNFN